MLPTCIVQPHPAGGYALPGPVLPHTLRYASEADAISYGHHLCREKGGRIVILDSQGRWQFTEHAEAEGSGLRILNEYRAVGK